MMTRMILLIIQVMTMTRMILLMIQVEEYEDARDVSGHRDCSTQPCQVGLAFTILVLIIVIIIIVIREGIQKKSIFFRK